VTRGLVRAGVSDPGHRTPRNDALRFLLELAFLASLALGWKTLVNHRWLTPEPTVLSLGSLTRFQRHLRTSLTLASGRISCRRP
jgi:hypothetical protein